MDEISPIKKRIIEFIEIQGVTKLNFCKSVDISYSNLKGKSLLSEIGGEALVKISSFYSDINLEWLITGKGSMLKEEKQSTYSQKEDILHVNKEVSTYKKSIKTCDEIIAENYQLKDDKMNLMQESKALMQQNSALMEDKITLIQENSDLKVENITLKQKLKELETLKKTTPSH